MPDERRVGVWRVPQATNDEKALLEQGPPGPPGRDGRDGKDGSPARGFRLQIIRDENDLMIEVVATPL